MSSQLTTRNSQPPSQPSRAINHYLSASSSHNAFSLPPPLHFSNLTKHLATWQSELCTDFDADFLLDGIAYGFKLITFPICEILPSDAKNYSSALCPENKTTLDKLFKAEIELGRFTLQTFKPIRIQSIGAVPKKDSAVPRPITDCSRPFENSLNAYLYADKFSFATIEHAVNQSTPNCFYSVIDIESAYRWVPVYPPHTQLQGFRWTFNGEPHENYYVDNYLCFGLSIAPAIFNRISCAIVRMMERAGHKCLSYLDDFLVVAETFLACRSAQYYLINLLIRLGFAINWAKIVGPKQRIQFLGLLIDSVLARIELPHDKLLKLESLAKEYMLRTKVSKHELQIITGHIAFASRAIYGARPFARLFIDAVNSLKRPYHKLRLTPLLIAELKWWSEFAATFNGLCPCSLGQRRPVVIIQTDASFSGFGAVMGKDWLAGFWPGIQPPTYANIPSLNNLLLSPALDTSFTENINFLELMAAIIAVLVWAPKLAGSLVIIQSDNQSTVSFLKKCTSKNLAAVSWLKKTFYASLEHDFRVTASHTPGVTNVLPDALSRLADKESHLSFFVENFAYSLPSSDLPPHSFSYAFAKSRKLGQQTSFERHG